MVDNKRPNILDRAAQVIEDATLDVAFAMFYLSETQGDPVVLARSVSVADDAARKLDSFFKCT